MRKLILGAVTISFGALGLAGVPNRIVYQGRLSKSGVGVSGEHIFTARIYPAANPNIGWQSDNILITLPATGEFSLVLDVNADLDWLNDDLRMKITVDGEPLSPDESFGTNPYAFAARTVDAGGVNTAAIQAGAVTDVKVSTISAAKVMLPGTSSPLTVWQSTVAGQQDKINSAKIFGSIPTTPSAHGASHVAGNTDPISNLQATQVAGTAVVRSAGVTQVIQATSTVPALDIKGNPGSNSKILRIFDSGSLGQAGSIPDEQASFDKDGNFVSSRSITASSMILSGPLAAGAIGAGSITTTGTANFKGEATAGSMRVSGDVRLSTTSGRVGVGIAGVPEPIEAAIEVRGGAGSLLDIVKGGGASSDSILRVFGDTSGGLKTSDRFRITREGRFGLNITTPTAIVDISGPGRANQCCSSEVPTLALSENTVSDGRRPTIQFHGANDAEGYIMLRGDGAMGRRFVLAGNQSSPISLTITGNAWKPGGGSWVNSSDERLKENIHTLKPPLGRLLSLRGVEFEYKDPSKQGGLSGPQIGMIAQEVEKVFPEWVVPGPDGYKAIGYRGFEALMVEALRQLKTENDDLKRRIGELESSLKK